MLDRSPRFHAVDGEIAGRRSLLYNSSSHRSSREEVLLAPPSYDAARVFSDAAALADSNMVGKDRVLRPGDRTSGMGHWGIPFFHSWLEQCSMSAEASWNLSYLKHTDLNSELDPSSSVGSSDVCEICVCRRDSTRLLSSSSELKSEYLI